jgi:alpha-mannosidase
MVIPGAVEHVNPLVSCSTSNIVVDCVKKAEESDDIIIRVHEGHGQSTKVALEFGPKVEYAVECDMLEQELAPLKLVKAKLVLKFSPFEIKTLKLRFRTKR